MSDDPRPPEEEPEAGHEPESDGQSTEEQFALEADAVNPPTDEHFDGIPPDQIVRGKTEDLPALEPEFAEALRAAGGKPPEPRTSEPSEPEAPSPPPAGDPGETIEYAPGEAPDTEQSPEPDLEATPASAPPPQDPSLDRTVIIKEGRDEAREAIALAAETGRPFDPKPPPRSGDPEPPPKRKHLWLRYLVACFIIVASFASATTAVGVLRLDDIISELRPIPDIQDKLAKVQSGEPETFLILGSDRRAIQAAEGDRGLSDTTILLRVDPDNNRIAVLNIPRDLKVYIPGYGTDKFNAAYSLGGPKLTLRTIRRLTAGTDLKINHLVNIDFLGFAQAINAIDCVYVDVDRRYYHSNVGVPAASQYSEINIQPGYQRLCGADGLAYVRYRHTDTDLVRAARQQDFLREARQRVPASELLKEVTGVDDKLIKTFTSHTQSDISDFSTMIDVLKLMIGARNAPIKEIHFPATLGPSYVYASHAAIVDAVDQFLRGEASGGPRGSLDGGSSSSSSGGGKDKGKTGSKQGKPKKHKDKAPPTPTPESDGLVDASTSGLEHAQIAARKMSPGFKIYYPTRVPPGSEYDDSEVSSANPWVYHVNDTSGDTHQAYRTVLAQFANDGTHYFGVEGIDGWSDPPYLDDPSESRTIGKLDSDIFLDGDRVRVISWHDGDNTYWISNDLLQTLTNDQMLGIVRSMRYITPNPKHHPKGRKHR